MRWARITSVFLSLAMVVTSMGVLLATENATSGDQPPKVASYDPVIASILENVSVQSLYRYNYDLQNFSSRYVYSNTLNESAIYIVNELSSNPNLIVESQYFQVGTRWVRNVIATLPSFNPANKTIYILGGHYDSYSNSNPTSWAPGADDDGSGTVAAMEAARVLSKYKFNSTIVLAAWTAEELGLLGSRYYANGAAESGVDVGGMIQLDMIGYDPGNLMGLRAVSNFESTWLLNEFWNANQDYAIGLNLVTSINPGAGGSDHASFWAEDYPAIFAIETNFNDYYHSGQDTVDKMNFELVKKTTNASIATLAKIAGILTPGVGAIAFDKTHYGTMDVVEIRLYDTDLNTNPGVAETVVVNVRSSAEPAGEQVTLTEVGPDEGVFKGSIPLTETIPVGGMLSVYESDLLNVTYWDDNPQGLRWTSAAVDGYPPLIKNVAVRPSVTTAEITWETNEEADSLANYGLTTALGDSEYDMWDVKSHSIFLSNLSPGTKYYFEVASTDRPGNQALDDNGGTKYSFMTLTGISSVPEYGYVGWVREEEATGNHFTDPEIIVGWSNFRHTTYKGAAQFRVSPIPDTAIITNASLQFYGGRWIYRDTDYNWNVTLLNASSDPDWVNHSFSDIEGAGVDAIIPSILENSDLVEGEWNYFYFQPSQYGLLRDHFNNSIISFRLNGPTSRDFWFEGLIFAWVSGYEAGSSFASPLSPRLTVTYTLTGDTTGPATINPQVSRENGAGDPVLVLSATTTDVSTGNSNITNVEYFVDSDPGYGNGVVMVPSDGSFDSPVEDSTIIIDVPSWTPGVYDFYLRGRDEAGNWGPTVEISNVSITPPLPPVDIDARLEGLSLEHVNVSWTLSGDDGQGDNDVDHYSIYYGNVYDRTAESYQYLSSAPAGLDHYLHSLAGNGDSNSYFYVVLANDTDGNARRASNHAAKFARSLSAGIHLLSNPLVVTDNGIESVLQTVAFDRVWRYDPAAPTQWVKVDLTKSYGGSFVASIEMAYWVEVTTNSIYAVAGRVPNSVTISLSTGWNLVSYPSFVDRVVADALLGIGFSRIEAYDPLAPPYHLTQLTDWDYMTAGYGYWIYATVDSTWRVEN
ncbi:MAG: Zn-dependent exopeptidase M28 [Methanomassiliicoccales archaeon]|nr:MAG: Zn-dependent exopeptidase M28 [Methanomassiliicoccales archaeon]